MDRNNIVNFQESTTILNAYTESLETYWMHHVYVYQSASQSIDSSK